MRSRFVASVLPAVAVLAACGLFGSGGASTEPPPATTAERDTLATQAADADSAATRRTRSVYSDNGAIVLTGSALEDGSGNVLAAMRGKVPNFRVQNHANACPEITLRNHVSFSGVVNPLVYVDGTLSTDTCILESLRSGDVERVEVYPLGFTTRPGYGRHAHGLILVFMRSI